MNKEDMLKYISKFNGLYGMSHHFSTREVGGWYQDTWGTCLTDGTDKIYKSEMVFKTTDLLHGVSTTKTVS